MKREWIQIANGRWRLVDMDAAPKATDRNLTRRDTLTAREKRGLYLQTGQRFGSMSECRAYMKANDMRFIDKGDRQDRARTRMKEWVRDTSPGNRGREPFKSTRG